MRKLALIFLVAIIFGNKVQGQEKSKFQVWTDFTPSYKLEDKWKVGGDVGYWIEPVSSSKTVYFRPGINYTPNRVINFTLGIANFNYWNAERLNSIEIRT